MSLDQLISAMYKRPPMWNSKNISYKNRKITNQLWQEIKNELGIEVPSLKKKWKELKDRYTKELNKVLAPRPSDAGNDCEPMWEYYYHMKFMRDEILTANSVSNLDLNHDNDSSKFIDKVNVLIVKEKSTTSNSGTTSTASHTSAASTTSTVSNTSTASHTSAASTTSTVSNTSTASTTSTQQTANNTITDIQRKTPIRNQSQKRKSAIDMDTEISGLKKRHLSLEENISQNSDDYYFLMSLLPHMEKLPLYQKLRLRQTIDQVIMDELNCSTNYVCARCGQQTK